MNGLYFHRREWLDAMLDIMNLDYYEKMLTENMKATKVPDEGSISVPEIKEGDTAICSNCGMNRTVYYMYGGKNPLCQVCFDSPRK